MQVIVEHQKGLITSVVVVAVAGQLRRRVPIGADPALLPAYLKANQGKRVKQSDYEKLTQLFAERLLLLINGTVVQLPTDTLVLAVAKYPGGATALFDLVQNWQSGKYRVADGKITPATDWQEPTILIAPAADPLAP
jgi:hypothetical protein